MFNCCINYKLNQDGIILENSIQGEFYRVGNLYRVVFYIDNDGNESEHSYVKLSDNSFKITVKGDSEYSLTVKSGSESSATLKTGGISFPFTSFTKNCVASADENGMELYAEYAITAFNQTMNNVLTLKVCKMGEVKC